MIENKIRKEIASRFRMPGLNHSVHKSFDETDTFQANLIWMISTDYFTSLTKPPLTLAIINSDKWSKGLILFPSFEERYNVSLEGIEFETQLDLMQTYFSSLDLTCDHDITKTGNYRIRDFYLYVSTKKFYANLAFKDPHDSTTQIRELWNSFLHILDLLVDKYDIDELRSYTRHR